MVFRMGRGAGNPVHRPGGQPVKPHRRGGGPAGPGGAHRHPGGEGGRPQGTAQPPRHVPAGAGDGGFVRAVPCHRLPSTPNAAALTAEDLFDTRPDPALCGWITSPLTDPEQVPYGERTGAEVSLALSDTAACRCGTLSSLTLSGADPADGYYRAYDISFSSGDSPTQLIVPENWIFIGPGCNGGVFIPASNYHYEMVGAWHDGILRWVVLSW